MRRLAVLLLLLPMTACGDERASDAESQACADPTISGTEEDDRLRGTPEADVIDGGDGNDRIEGLGGNDVLCGGEGADVLDGGAGDDELYGGADERLAADTDYYEWFGDTLAGGPGDDMLEPGFSETDEHRTQPDRISFARSATGVTVDLIAGTATGEGKDTIVGKVHGLAGSAFGDRLLGTDGDDEIDGNDGPDHIEGRSGADDLHAGNGLAETNGHPDFAANVVNGGPGKDYLDGSEGDDELIGGPGDDGLHAGGGSDRIDGGEGDDELGDTLTGTGDQRIDGGPGVDGFGEWYLQAPDAEPNDVLTRGIVGALDLAAGLLTTTIDGTAVRVAVLGVENASPTYGSWTLIGTDGPNKLFGGFDDQGPATIRAGGGDDTLMGTFGFDTIDGGPGRDELIPTGRVEDELSGIEETR